MAFWLLKSEPDAYSWDDLLRDGRTDWTGVRNHQAARNLKAMRIGDKAFFYHSNIGKAAVGIVEVVSEALPDNTDETGKFVMVGVSPLEAFARPVGLADIKADPSLAGMALIRQSRLSVSPVSAKEWAVICKRGQA
jgi:predicted RNA-binding protein with PUA-like domain